LLSKEQLSVVAWSPLLWHGLPTMPTNPTGGLPPVPMLYYPPQMKETIGRTKW